MPRIFNLSLTVLVLAVLFGLSLSGNVAQDGAGMPDVAAQSDGAPDPVPPVEPQTGSEKTPGDDHPEDPEPLQQTPLDGSPVVTPDPLPDDSRKKEEEQKEEGTDVDGKSPLPDNPGTGGSFGPLSAQNDAPDTDEEETGGEEKEEVSFFQTSAFTWSVFLLLLGGSYAVGQKLSKAWRLPDHGFRIFILIFVTLGGVISAYLGWGNLTLGIDLSGGVVLIYDVEDPNETIDMDQMARAIGKRINPAGVKEIAISARGSQQLQIIIPRAGAAEVASIRRTISESGALEFRILASRRYPKDIDIINQAGELWPGSRVVLDPVSKEKLAEWIPVDKVNGGSVIDNPDVETRKNGEETVVLVLFNDNCDVTGKYLSWVGRGTDEEGKPGVSFHFDAQGANRFSKLTSDNLPDSSQPEKIQRYLGILMNGMVHSAPSIRTTIKSSGIISFGKRQGPDGHRQLLQDIEELITVLSAGSLPTALKKEPASELQIGATLGEDTIQKAKFALVLSLVIVMSFMLVYYRTAGLIACFCVLTNLALIIATMLAVRAAFTLPGLAGLVLTLGMAIDANILIYERLREELAAGASLKMAIRNAYSKALSAIVDSNVTTIITGVILYAVGSEQVKGFAVTLILGIVFSMFTAIYCARTIMDCMEAQRPIRTFKMMQLFRRPNINFIAARWYCVVFSIILTVIGLAAVGMRGRGLLDIDFMGGVSVEAVFKEPQQIENIRGQLNQLGSLNDLSVQNVLSSKFDEERGIKRDTRFIITTSTPPGKEAEEYKDDVCSSIEETFKNVIDYERFDYEFVESDDATKSVVRLTVHPPLKLESLDAKLHDAITDDSKVLQGKYTLKGTDSFKTSPHIHAEWTMEAQASREIVEKLLQSIKEETDKTPYFANPTTVGHSVARDTQIAGLLAILGSLVCIVLYIWLRFQKLVYGLAAVIGLVHVVLVALGLLAISKWLVTPLGFLMVEEFKIGLPVVAAFLTIIGYALNDTIILFDRVRENRSKSPKLTDKMVNDAINQTLSRTVLTTGTTALVTLILYFWGGQGIHTFAFTMTAGILFGTYGTIGICAPLLLWMGGEFAGKKDEQDAF